MLMANTPAKPIAPNSVFPMKYGRSTAKMTAMPAAIAIAAV